MHAIFDQFVKQMVREGAAPACAVNTEAEVHHDAQRADLWLNPDPARVPLLAPLGLLGRICSRPCIIESFHKTPIGAAVVSCVYKLLGFHRALQRSEPSTRLPMQWVISSGRPRTALLGLGFRASRRWGAGVYRAPALLRTTLIVVSELPVQRDTLLVRLMGAGEVFKQAIAELRALPTDAPERCLALPILLSLWREIPDDATKRTREQEEFKMTMRDVAAELVQEGLEKGLKQGLEKGLEKGLKQGLSALARVFERRLGRKLAANERAILAERLGSLGPERLGDVVVDLSPDALTAWLGDPAAR